MRQKSKHGSRARLLRCDSNQSERKRRINEKIVKRMRKVVETQERIERQRPSEKKEPMKIDIKMTSNFSGIPPMSFDDKQGNWLQIERTIIGKKKTEIVKREKLLKDMQFANLDRPMDRLLQHYDVVPLTEEKQKVYEYGSYTCKRRLGKPFFYLKLNKAQY
jgi:hypothetical protein